MNENPWHIDSCGTGRQYMLGHEAAVARFADSQAIIDKIEEGIRPYLFAEPAIRLVLDSPLANPERVILSIPCISDHDRILKNFAKSIYGSIMGYYYSADPKTSHFGISHTILDGQFNSLLRREMERHFAQTQNRPDMAARILEGVSISTKSEVAHQGRDYLAETIKQGLNIYVGYRIHAHGELINHAQMFLPMESGREITELVYYNLEQIINQNFVAYDETGTGYLSVSETLVFKELESVLQRARLKENTRMKILNNIQFNTVFTPDPRTAFGPIAGDSLYDALNKVEDERLKKATQLSSSLYAAVMVKGSEMTQMNNPGSGSAPSAIAVEKSMKAESTKVPEPPGTRVPSKEEAQVKKAVAKKGKKEGAETQDEELQELKKE